MADDGGIIETFDDGDGDDRPRRRHPRQRLSPSPDADYDHHQEEECDDDGHDEHVDDTSSPVEATSMTSSTSRPGGTPKPFVVDGTDADVNVVASGGRGEVSAASSDDDDGGGVGGDDEDDERSPSKPSKPAVSAATATTTTTTRRRDRVIKGARYVAHVTEKVTTKRPPGSLPGAVITKLESGAGREIIRTMTVVRTPLEDVARAMLQVISLGSYDDAVRDSPYDSMFHLSLLLNGRYGLHKCEVIKLVEDGVDDDIVKPESEIMDAPLFSDDASEGKPTHLTIASLLMGTRLFMGDRRFTNYDPRKNNCQDFIISILRSCNASTSELERFVKQDAEEIFRRLPLHAHMVAKLVTDGAAVGDKLWEEVRLKLNESDSELASEVRLLRERYGDRIPDGERLAEVASLLKEMKLKVSSSSHSEETEEGEKDGSCDRCVGEDAGSRTASPSSNGNARQKVKGKITGGVAFLRDMHRNLADEYMP